MKTCRVPSLRRSQWTEIWVWLIAPVLLVVIFYSRPISPIQMSSTSAAIHPDKAIADVIVSDEELGPAEIPSKGAKTRFSELPSDHLVDALADIDKPAIGLHPTTQYDAFLAIDDDPVFAVGILGSEEPAVFPAMRELVCRSVRAIPTLLNHLDDTRATKLKVKAFAGVASHDAEYLPRGLGKWPQGVRAFGFGEIDRSVDEYTVKVGDVCFVLVGQVVNRQLRAVRYQPTGCVVINSPVATPALARAARDDWTNLTIEEHRRLLYQEAKGGCEDALVRLRFYYPQTAQRLKAPTK